MTPPLVEVVIEDPRWHPLALDGLAEQAARAALAAAELAPEGFEIALLAASDARIAELNAAFRGRGGATNVLSWPAVERAAPSEGAPPTPPRPGRADDPESLGDIALAFETCAREAAEAGKPFDQHLLHLVVHGTLHLLGYDHQRDGDATLMESLETAALAELGVPDPYQEAARDRIA